MWQEEGGLPESLEAEGAGNLRVMFIYSKHHYFSGTMLTTVTEATSEYATQIP